MADQLSVKGAKFIQEDKPTDQSQVTNERISEVKPKHIEKYWKQPHAGGDDIVVIHVCDENRQISKDFCCKRGLLVRYMKYFERFLAENVNGYDDIDISVHCDVEIFEWLMTFVHEPEKPPQLEKSIVVSILISSEFLQMESLVDVCLQFIAENLNDIIKLPIDLSCISEKLVHKLALLTSPKVLAQTKDRKDKILNKLYKRRVELDFSRKSGAKGALRTIASSLTCCRHCGFVFLDSCVSQLTCRQAPPLVDFRGRLTRVHVPLQSWSLTAYLKALHSGGMGWDCIYWHVWSSCVVFQVQEMMFCLLEVDRYSVQADGLLVINRSESSKTSFSFFNEDALDCTMKLSVSEFHDASLPPFITPTLNPNRPPTVLTPEIFELICSQMKYIANAQHRALIDGTLKSMTVASITSEETLQNPDAGDVLWGEGDERVDVAEERGRGRSLSPAPPHRKDRDAGNKKSSGHVDGSDRKMRSSSLQGARTSRSHFTSKDSSSNRLAAAESPKTVGDESVDSNSDNLESLALRTVPVEVALQAAVCRGAFMGIRLWQHPLQTRPMYASEVRNSINESGLPDSKKFEWELDLLRELDEKKMDRYEFYLSSSRNLLSDPQFNADSRNTNISKFSKKKGWNEDGKLANSTNHQYYRDKGKLPWRFANCSFV